MNTYPTQSAVRRRRRSLAVGLLFMITMIGLMIVKPSPAGLFAIISSDPSTDGSSGSGLHGQPSAADGKIADGQEISVFDEDVPAVGRLDQQLLAALQDAASDAADDGVTFIVNSGWRSPAFQEQLLQDAIAEYGSEEEALRWAATPETSAHVSGNAVDLGPFAATDWLAQRGAAYGLCQIYANELWHYELRTDAYAEGCPQMYADPTQDPRMQH